MDYDWRGAASVACWVIRPGLAGAGFPRINLRVIHLIRHAQAEKGVEVLDPGLSELGRSQADAAAAALRETSAARLLSSPLARTRETAEPIAHARGLQLELEPAVAEVFVPGQSVAERQRMLGPLLAGCWSEQSVKLRDWRQRVLDVLVGLGSADTLIVSHFVAINAAIGAALGDDRVTVERIANASITRIVVDAGSLKIQSIGDTSHLVEAQLTASFTAPGARAIERQ